MIEKKHILHIIDALDYGGAQMLLVSLAGSIPKDIYRMSVCVLQPYTQLKDQLESNGTAVFCLDRPRPSVFQPHKFMCYVYRSVKDIITICEQTNVQVIHCHLSDADFLGTIAGILSKAETIISTNHYPDQPSGRCLFDPRNYLRLLATRLLYNKGVDWVVAVSDDIAEKLVKDYRIRPEKIKIVINGIDVDSFKQRRTPNILKESLGLYPTDKILTTVGRLITQKGHTYLIDAMSSLVKQRGDIKLLVAGDGELKDQLKAQESDFGI